MKVLAFNVLEQGWYGLITGICVMRVRTEHIAAYRFVVITPHFIMFVAEVYILFSLEYGIFLML